MDPETWLAGNLETLLQGGLLPEAVRARYEQVVHELVQLSEPLWAGLELQRIHGDCHLGNILRAPEGFVFLDFDDMVMGPPVQDLWLVQGGRDAWAQRRLDLMLEGYEVMLDFDRASLRLIEPLRAMRMVHHATWLARRWEDPAFPIAFPDFGTGLWWERETRDLSEQLAVVRQTLSSQWP